MQGDPQQRQYQGYYHASQEIAPVIGVKSAILKKEPVVAVKNSRDQDHTKQVKK
jgi:hypothetical protein